MKKGLVNIAQGTPEQLSKFKRYMLDAKEVYPTVKLKTHVAFVIFAAEQAARVPALEQEIKELKEKVKELEKQIVEDREMRG